MRYRLIGNSLNFLITVNLGCLKNIAQNAIHSKVKNGIFLGVVLGKTSLYQLARKTSFTKLVLQYNSISGSIRIYKHNAAKYNRKQVMPSNMTS